MKTSQKYMKKSKDTKKQRKARIAWVKEHMNWIHVDWIKEMFGDKIDFSIQNHAENIYACKRLHETFSSQCILPTSKHPPGVMIWVYMTPHGIVNLHICGGMMNATKYAAVLKMVQIIVPLMTPCSFSIDKSSN